MKKTFLIFIVGIMLLQYLYIPNVNGKTLSDLKKELQVKQNELSSNKIEKELTEKEIQSANTYIANIQNSMEGIFKDINNLDKEILKLNDSIIKKDKEMKEIMKFVQISNGESSYMEYIFGAKSFTDFIYRMAISEQLTSYNDKIIKQYNEMIETNKKKQVDLANKRVELNNKQAELSKKLQELGTRRKNILDLSVSIEDEINFQRELIDLYVSKGCKDNENIATCGKATLPSGTSFYRPLVKGYATSNYGYRDYINGIPASELHTGLDLSIRPNDNVPIYSSGNGMVAGIMYKNSCGGNMVYVHHKINNVTYTTLYAHLKSVSVYKGQPVDRNTQIGIMGGGPDTWGWDKCSTGAHLHFTVATGLYGSDYTSWNTFMSKTFNPRNVVNFPNGLGINNSFEDRLTKY